MQANIKAVTVHGRTQDRDADLHHVQQSRSKFRPKAGALLEGGKQFDLWNAVQSLLQ